MDKFKSFLQKHRTSGTEFTHTGVRELLGKYNVSQDVLPKFYAKYAKAFKDVQPLGLTEAIPTTSPIRFDLDFRFTLANLERQYDEKVLVALTKLIQASITKYLEIKDSEHLNVYILEKKKPKIKNGEVCDGVHIVIPNIHADVSTQYAINLDVIKNAKTDNIFGNMVLSNKIDNVFDTNVILKQTPWTMYGSNMKDEKDYYKLTHIYDEDAEDRDIDNYGVSDLIETLSVRRSIAPLPIKQSKVAYIKTLYDSLAPVADTTETKKSENKSNDYDPEYVAKLVNILSEKRAEDYNDWISVGWCLYNINPDLFELWDTFSQKSSKYKQSDCKKAWKKIKGSNKNKNLSMGTLCYWAKQDNLEQYYALYEESIHKHKLNALSKTHHDVAVLIKRLYEHEYVCSSIKNKTWFGYKNHRWEEIERGYLIRRAISKELPLQFKQMRHELKNEKKELQEKISELKEEKKDYDELKIKLDCVKTQIDNVRDLIDKLKTVPFKDNVMTECCELFYNKTFEGDLDSNPDLIGFNNGVYDLIADTFRKGNPADLISFSTQIDWIPYNSESVESKEIIEFITKIFPKKDEREHMLTLLSTYLSGHNREEKFHICTGTGCHGVGTLIRMYDGKAKKVEDIVKGDLILGDDNKERKVLNAIKDTGALYEIKPVVGESFIVNADHVLCLQVRGAFNIWHKDDDYKLSYYMISNENKIENVRLEMKTAEMATFMQKVKGINFLRDGDVVELKVKDYVEFEDLEFMLYDVKGKTSTFTSTYVKDGLYYGFELDGNQKYQTADGWIHHNSNGKSKLIELFETSFGDYCIKFPVTLLTQKRAASNAATPELACTRGKRLGTMQEPDHGAHINVGFMKDLSGRDRITARQIYKEQISFIPQFKLLLMCNHLPGIPSDDGGTWRRIRVIQFLSKFVDEPKKPNEYKIDRKLSEKMHNWRSAFIALLLEYYKTYKKDGLIEPESVVADSKKYQFASDINGQFVSDKLMPVKKGGTKLRELFDCFRSWYVAGNMPGKTPCIKDIKEYMERTHGPMNPSYGWRFKIKEDEPLRDSSDSDQE